MTDTIATYMTANGAPNLWTDSGTQYAVMFTLDGNMKVAKRARTGMTWAQHTIDSSTAGNALVLPNTDGDSHKAPTIAVDGLGYIHVWANMHDNALRYIRSTNVHDITAWTAKTMPSSDVHCTYPTVARFSDGTLWCYIRMGNNQSQAGMSNSFFWTLGPAATTWSAATQLFNGYPPGASTTVENETNYSAYLCDVYVDANDRLHLFWVWRWTPQLTLNITDGVITGGTNLASAGSTFTVAMTGSEVTGTGIPANTAVTYVDAHHVTLSKTCTNGSGLTITLDSGRSINILPSYAYSDDKGATWHAVDATTLTLPISPVNNLACHTGMTHPVGVYFANFYNNGGGLVTDGHGYPHATLSDAPWWHIWWDGTVWRQQILADPSTQGVLNGYPLLHRTSAFWYKNALWVLCAASTPYRHKRFFKADGTISARMSGRLTAPQDFPGVQFAADWDCAPDPIMSPSGSIEILVPDGDQPRLFQFGANAQLRNFVANHPTLLVDGASALTGVTSNTGTGVFTKTSHGKNGFSPVVVTGLVNTTGIVNGGCYWPVTITSNTFQLSASFGGPPITLTGGNDGSIVVSAVDHTGTLDVSGPLNSIIQGLPAHSIFKLLANGVYRAEFPWDWSTADDIALDAQNATLKCTVTAPYGDAFLDGHRSNITMTRATGLILIQNLTILGANPNAGISDAAYNPAYEHQHNLEAYGTLGIKLRNVTFGRPYGDWVYASIDERRNLCSFVDIERCVADRTGRQGFSMIGVAGWTISNCNLQRIRFTALDVEPNNAFSDVYQGYFGQNTIGTIREYLATLVGATSSVHDLMIDRNTLVGAPMKIKATGPASPHRANLTITDNTSDTTYGAPAPVNAAIDVTNWDDVTVTGNRIPLQASRPMIGVRTTRCSAVTPPVVSNIVIGGTPWQNNP